MSRPTHAQAWRGFLAYLSPVRMGLAVALAVMAATLLNPIFITPYPILLGRTLFVGILALLVFSAAGQWPRQLPAWLARWVLQVVLVVCAILGGTLFVYLVAVGGDLDTLLNSDARIMGFAWIAGAGLILGPLLAMGSLYRQRDAELRSQALSFELERSELERQALDARLRLLQAQVEPHFLFNTLANVRALVETGSPQAASVLRSLIAYLRAAMPRLHDESASLADELALVSAYLDLMHLRMPDRLQFSIEVPQSLQTQRFPPMALLTLVENAVRHGIDPSVEGGYIRVGGRMDGERIVLWVEDSGVGLSGQQGGSSGTGLRNLAERMRVVYGESARLDLRENPPHGLIATLTFTPAAHMPTPPSPARP